MCCSDFQFPNHLQDLFDVIVSLEAKNPMHQARFQYFVHRRAYRKLGARILDFSTHLGKLPFDIFPTEFPGLGATDVTLHAGSKHHAGIAQYVKPFSPPLEESKEPKNPANTKPKTLETGTDWTQLRYPVNAETAPKWVHLLRFWWSILCDQFLDKAHKTVTPSPPTAEATRLAVAMISGLQALKPVLKILLSYPGISLTLQDLGKFPDLFRSW